MIDGQYRLRIEGYDVNRPKKSIFAKETQLTFRPEFLSIVVQSNRKIYRNEMSSKFVQNYNKNKLICFSY